MRARRIWMALVTIVALSATACTSVDEATPETTQASGDGGATTATAAPTTAGEGEAGDTTTTSDAGEEAVAQRDYRFVVVTHGQSSDPFWSVAANGVNAAGEDMGVTVEYQAPGSFDMVEMGQIIEAAVASQPDGLVVSIPDPEALSGPIEAAVEAGIPVISMNSGSDVFADFGILVHVGQTEYEAGLLAGERMAEAGVTNALCINQEVGNTALDQRCDGFRDGLGGNVEVIPVDLADPTGSQATVSGALSSNPDADGILALGPTGALPTLAAVQEAGADVELATFDLAPEVLQAIIDGEMLFAIDQAQYLQGYLPIVLLTQYLETGAIPLGSVDRVILTGPQIVTADTAADVIDAASAGLR